MDKKVRILSHPGIIFIATQLLSYLALAFVRMNRPVICVVIFAQLVPLIYGLAYTLYFKRLGKRRLSGRGLIVLAVLFLCYCTVPIQVAVQKKFVFEAFKAANQGMTPTLHPGEDFIVQKRIEVRRWDVIVTHPPHLSAVTVGRVVALPGETVEIRHGSLFINGVVCRPPQTLTIFNPVQPAAGRPVFGCEGNPLTLNAGEYFELGDNSTSSLDSRYFGAFPKSAIVGVATCIYYPLPRSL